MFARHTTVKAYPGTPLRYSGDIFCRRMPLPVQISIYLHCLIIQTTIVALLISQKLYVHTTIDPAQCSWPGLHMTYLKVSLF